MKIIEKQLVGKTGNIAICEDGLFIKDHLVVVIDGVTSKSDNLYYGYKSGKYAKDVIIEELNIINLFQDTKVIIKALNKRLYSEASKRFENKIAIEDYLRACVLIYNDIEKKLYCYGDSQYIVNDQYYGSYMEIDEVNSKKRATKIKELIDNGYTEKQLLKNDLGREAIKNDLLKQMNFENILGKYGYACLNGYNYNEDLLKVVPVNSQFLIMATDGYPKLFSTLKESEDYLKYIIKTDPLCYKNYISTKGIADNNISYDDRCFVKIMLY